MGQRHNRRRTRMRPRSRNDSNPNLTSTPSLTTPVCDLPDSVSRSFAPTWHYGYVTRQTRDRTPRPEMVEQYRLFGGEPGDDESLCYRMLEYFGGLDYIDSSQSQMSSLPG